MGFIIPLEICSDPLGVQPTTQQALDPPKPLPRLEFPVHLLEPEGGQEEEWERAEREAWERLGTQERAGVVLEGVVLNMKVGMDQA